MIYREIYKRSLKISLQIDISEVKNGQSSGWDAVNAEVSQGSVLGPLFFMIEIHQQMN